MAEVRLDLLEREAQLAAVVAAVGAAAAGEGQLLVLEGPAGIGKTRLADDARTHARAAGMQVLLARGGELEHEFAYGVVRQLFERLLLALEPAEREALLAGAARPAGALFGTHEGAGAPEPDGTGASFAVLHGLYWLAANLAATRPLVLCVDDLQWCDEPSLRFLGFLARRLEGLPVLILAVLRSEEELPDPELVAALAADPAARTVRLGALSEAGTIALVGRQLPGAEPAFGAACHAATCGNPLLVLELARALEAEGVAPTDANAATVQRIGPESVLRAVRVRLARLPPEASDLAEAAAVLGDGVPVTDAARLAGLEPTTGATAAAALVRAGILGPGPDVAFVHPVVRAAIYGDLGLGTQRKAHELAALLLTRQGYAPERIAAHLLASQPSGDAAAISILREAARRSLAGGAPDVAVTYLQRALEERPSGAERAGVLLELGTAELSVRADRAAQHLAEALAEVDDADSRAHTSLLLSRALYVQGAFGPAVETAERALAEPSLDPELRARLEGMLLLVAVYNTDWRPLADDLLASFRAEEAGEGIGDRVRLALTAYHGARAGRLAREPAVERARRALAPPEWAGDLQSVMFVTAADLLLAADVYDEAAAATAELLETGHAVGSPFLVALGSFARAHVALVCGDLASATADAAAAIEAAEAHGHGPARQWASGYLAQALVERGELAAAEDALARGELTGALSASARVTEALLARGRLRLAQGRVREGVDDLLDLGQRYAALGGVNPALMAWRSAAAEGLRLLGDAAAAAELAADEVALARDWGAPRALARALRVHGTVLGGAAGLEQVRAAVGLVEGSPASLELAACRTELGSALRRAGRRRDAREHLQAGLDLAVRCGARPLQERALSELVATGARPRRLTVSGRDSLTATQLRVAQLAAEGQSNREIAQRLFVTTKTVETHLGQIYRKLGLTSRAQLAEALERRRGDGVTA